MTTPVQDDASKAFLVWAGRAFLRPARPLVSRAMLIPVRALVGDKRQILDSVLIVFRAYPDSSHILFL